jgi:hypothetical protein
MRLGHPDATPPPLMEAPRTGPWSRPLSRGCPREVSQRTYELREVAERAALSRADRSPLAHVATGAATLAGGLPADAPVDGLCWLLGTSVQKEGTLRAICWSHSACRREAAKVESEGIHVIYYLLISR